MNKEKIFAVVKKAVVKINPNLTEEDITPKASLQNDLGLDSLNRIELSTLLQDALGCSLPEDDKLSQWKTIGEVVDYFDFIVNRKNN